MSKDQSQMTIFRNASSAHQFTQISNHLLQNYELSNEARGFLTSILSLPVTWTFRAAWAIKKFRYTKRKFLKVCQELIDKGYMKRQQQRAEDGKIIGMVYLFTDVANAFFVGVEGHTLDNQGLDNQGVEIHTLESDTLYKETREKDTVKKNIVKKNISKKTNICHNVETKHEASQQTQQTDFFFHGEPSESATPTVSCESNSEPEKAPLQNAESFSLIPETWSSGRKAPEQQTEDSLFDLGLESKADRAELDQCQEQQPKDTPKGTPSLEICTTHARETTSSKTIHTLSTGYSQDINSVYGSSVNCQKNGLDGAHEPLTASEPVGSEIRSNALDHAALAVPLNSTNGPTGVPRTPDVAPTVAKPRSRRTAAQIGYSPAFDRFWEVYPARRGMSRPAAYKNWLAQDCEAVAEDVILGAKEYADDVDTSRRKNKGWSDAYIKHAQGWLTERRWEGYIAEIKKREAERIQREEWRAAEVQRQEAEAAAKAAVVEETLQERQARCAERDRLRLIEDANDIASIIVQCAELERNKNSYVSTRLWERLVAELRCLTKRLMPKRWRDFSRYPRETVDVIAKALSERGMLDVLDKVNFAMPVVAPQPEPFFW